MLLGLPPGDGAAARARLLTWMVKIVRHLGIYAGYELPLLLLAAFRAVIDEAHEELAARGHPELRPAHGFAMQAIGTFGATAADVGRRLGVSKQAAGKTIDRLAELGYVERGVEPRHRRRKLVRLTPRGTEALTLSATGSSTSAPGGPGCSAPTGSPHLRRTCARSRPAKRSASTSPAGSAASPPSTRPALDTRSLLAVIGLTPPRRPRALRACCCYLSGRRVGVR